jgi:hypothetical protein
MSHDLTPAQVHALNAIRTAYTIYQETANKYLAVASGYGINEVMGNLVMFGTFTVVAATEVPKA